MENLDPVDEIWYLAARGHDQLINGNYSAAKTYFVNAATMALEHSDNIPAANQQEFHSVAKTLLSMARNAHNLTFKQIEDGYLNKTLKNLNPHGTKLLQNTLSDPPKPDELQHRRNGTRKTNGQVKKTKIRKARIPLGREVESKKLVVWEPEKLMNGITLITGGSGSGKSETLKSLAKELIYKKIPVVILDLHGDLDIGIETISLDYRGQYSVNPMELTSYSDIDGGPAPHINRLLNQFYQAIPDRFSSTQKAWLNNLLGFCYAQKGITQDNPENWQQDVPTFLDLLDVIRHAEDRFLATGNQEYIRLLDTATLSTRVAVENRLAPILEHPAFSGGQSIPIQKITHEPVRILLKPLNTIDMQFLAADTIIRQIFAYLKSLGHINPDKERKFRTFILIDEVKILTGFRGKLNDPYSILNRLATEARKFGLGLILASQIFNHFGRDIKSNAATKLILRTMDIDETKRCAKEFKLKLEDLAILSKPGEGYLSTSKRPEARHIQMYPSEMHPFKQR